MPTVEFIGAAGPLLGAKTRLTCALDLWMMINILATVLGADSSDEISCRIYSAPISNGLRSADCQAKAPNKLKKCCPFQRP